jgi:hypothetical protein
MIALARIVGLSAAAAALVCAVAPAPVSAAASTQYLISELQRAAPSCRKNPTYGWEGRVSGNREADGRSIAISFAGCFPTQAECEAWRKQAQVFVTGLQIYNECKPRN